MTAAHRHHPPTSQGGGDYAVVNLDPSYELLASEEHDPHIQHIIVDEELKFHVYGYHRDRCKVVLFYLGCLLSGGILYLLSRWMHKWELFFTALPCPLAEANLVFIENHWGETLILPMTKTPFHGTVTDVFPKQAAQVMATATHAASLSAMVSKTYSPPTPVLNTSSSTTESTSTDYTLAPEDTLLHELTYFEYRYIRFLFNPLTQQFQSSFSWKDAQWTSIPSVIHGVSNEYQLAQRRSIFGGNSVNIEEKPTLKLLVEEVLHPFFIFQIASIILWSLDNYFYYATCIFLISAASTIATLVETKANMKRMRELSRFECSVKVHRAGGWKQVSSEDLVPGDVFEITTQSLPSLPCDAVLLEGECIINESMLTGESIPVSKVPISDQELDEMALDEEEPESSSRMAKFFLFSGTKIIRVRAGNANNSKPSPKSPSAYGQPRSSAIPLNSLATEGALAMVVRIGFNTTKGALVRSMLFPKPNNFSFYRDSFRFIGVLAIIAAVGFTGSVYKFILIGVPWYRIIIRALDLITIVVPPALPATMAIGTSFAISRLRKYNIFCISPPRVNMCGKIEVMVFDKTGTLTEDGLDVLGFRFTLPISLDHSFTATSSDSAHPVPLRFSSLYRSVDAVTAKPQSNRHSITSMPPSHMSSDSKVNLLSSSVQHTTLPGHPIGAETDYSYPLIVYAMASCQSIKVVDGEKIGDPLDLKMFEFTGWSIEEGGNVCHPDPSDDCTQFHRVLLSERQKTGNPDLATLNTIVRPPFTGEFKQNDSQTDLGVVRSFDFISHLRRMSVIACRIQYTDFSNNQFSDVGCKDLEVFVKGAPEVMHSICDPKSLPSDFNIRLKDYAHHGYRVIAVAWRKLDPMPLSQVHQLSRTEVESNLHFLGFVIFENKVKAGTTTVVETLEKAKIRQIMCTGDNILTAVSVSRECGLIDRHKVIFVPRFIEGDYTCEDAKLIWEDSDESTALVDPISFKLIPSSISHPVPYELAVTGDVFQWMVDFGTTDSLNRMLVKTQVYARMSPDQKTFLVERLQKLGYIVGFTGDGANDCGALTQADCGLSLSEAEASVAAPFTSKSTDLDCVLRVIREGRAALVTSFSCFKYMALYSLIQFTSVTILYSLNRNLADFQFMYIDIFLIIPVAIFMSYSGPNPDIYPKRPTASLMSKKVITSLLGQVLLQAIVQLLGFYWVLSQSWYLSVSTALDGTSDAISYDGTFVFLLANFQYVALAVVFNSGPPYRDHMFKNGPFMLTVVVMTFINAWLVLNPTEWVQELLELADLPTGARWAILITSAVHFLLCWLCETFVFRWITMLISRLQNGWSVASLLMSVGRRCRRGTALHHPEEGGDEMEIMSSPVTTSGRSRSRPSDSSHQGLLLKDMMLRSPRQHRTAAALAKRKRWEAKGKIYKIVTQDLASVS